MVRGSRRATAAGLEAEHGGSARALSARVPAQRMATEADPRRHIRPALLGLPVHQQRRQRRHAEPDPAPCEPAVGAGGSARRITTASAISPAPCWLPASMPFGCSRSGCTRRSWGHPLLPRVSQPKREFAGGGEPFSTNVQAECRADGRCREPSEPAQQRNCIDEPESFGRALVRPLGGHGAAGLATTRQDPRKRRTSNLRWGAWLDCRPPR